MAFIPQIYNYFDLMFSFVYLASISYLYSFAADLFDGMAARRLNQCSSFGGLLDMVTDRCSTLGLLFILYGEYGAVNRDHFGAYRMVSIRRFAEHMYIHCCSLSRIFLNYMAFLTPFNFRSFYYWHY